jgi:hypothetical protein
MANMTKPTIFFLGATGGCTLSALAHSLSGGYPCIALVRTPEKLTTLLRDAGIEESTLASLLTIHTGDALAVAAVKGALLRSFDGHVQLPRTIISGLGGAPKLRFNLPPLTIDQPTICQTGAATLVTALSEIYAAYPELRASEPLLCFISTGGLHKGEDDVLGVMQLLYRTLLSVPYRDKRAMDEVFFGEAGAGHFRTVVGVKPTILTGGPELGSEKVKVGRKWEPEVGYTISKKDVGAWIYRVIVLKNAEGWEGEMVTMTY